MAAPTPLEPPTATAEAPKKLSNAELKAQKQAEKAKRRAATVAAKEPPAPATAGTALPQGALSGGDPKVGKPKAKQERSGSSNAPAAMRIAAPRRQSAVGSRPTTVLPEKEMDVRSTIPECFSHLSMARRISLVQAEKDVDPAVLAVGQQMATFSLRDNIARLEATVLCFKKVGGYFSRRELLANPSIGRLFSPTRLLRAMHFRGTLFRMFSIPRSST